MKDELVKKVANLKADTAESIMQIGKLFEQAKTKLSKPDYEDFIAATRYSKNTASVRKWICIGRAYIRLSPLRTMLPPNWSTIHKLASLKPDSLRILEEQNILHSSVTIREIDEALGRPNKATSKKIKISLTFDLNMQNESVAEIYENIETMRKKYSFSITLTDAAQAAIDASTTNKATYKLAA
jgi:hypothetical protein